MKKLLILTMSLAIAFCAQAQLGGLVGGAVKKGLQKSMEKKVEQTVEQKADELLGVKNNQQDNRNTNTTDNQQQSQQTSVEDENHIPTPEEVMAMVPKIPTFQQLSDYLCEQSRENPRMLKLLANPTTTFLTEMMAAMASGYVTMMAGNGAWNIYTMDEQLRKDLGITEEQFEAMSEEEQAELARKYRAELEVRYATTMEVLAEDSKYNKLTEEYNEIEDQVGKLHSEAEEECSKIWKDKYADQVGDRCAYYRDAVPVYYKAVTQGMEVRKNKQLAVAKQIDERVKELAKQKPDKVFAGFFNMGGLCATAYVTDASLLTAIPDPR